MKIVSGDTGNETDMSQGSFELETVDEAEAVALAKKSFCEEHNITNWEFHADRFTIQRI